MFTVKEFSNVKVANEYIKKVLAELETSKPPEFQVIHSISETECCEDGGTWEDVSNILLSYLRDLDSQQGYMIFDDSDDDPHWDYLDWEEPDDTKQNIYRPPSQDEVYVNAGEGLVVVVNEFALFEDQYPVIVLKRSFWNNNGGVLDMLKTAEVGTDYTTKISPAIYIELFLQDQ